MSISVAQKIGFGMSANALADPGSNGTIRVNDAGISVCSITSTGNRLLADGGYPGQILLLFNDSGSARLVTDSATNLALTMDDGQHAICVYTGSSTKPWSASLLTAGTVT